MPNKYPPPPAVGTAYVDADGIHWLVHRLTSSDSFPDFYLVHLRFGPSPDAMDESWVLAPSEFDALVRGKDLTSKS